MFNNCPLAVASWEEKMHTWEKPLSLVSDHCLIPFCLKEPNIFNWLWDIWTQAASCLIPVSILAEFLFNILIYSKPSKMMNKCSGRWRNLLNPSQTRKVQNKQRDPVHNPKILSHYCTSFGLSNLPPYRLSYFCLLPSSMRFVHDEL